METTITQSTTLTIQSTTHTTLVGTPMNRSWKREARQQGQIFRHQGEGQVSILGKRGFVIQEVEEESFVDDAKRRKVDNELFAISAETAVEQSRREQ